MDLGNYPWISDYMLKKNGAKMDFKEEWDWYRFLVGNKMFGAICGHDDVFTLLTVKCDEQYSKILREKYRDILPGYYMNKTYWNSIKLDGNVPIDVVKDMIDCSYRLVFSELSKKSQFDILNKKESV